MKRLKIYPLLLFISGLMLTQGTILASNQSLSQYSSNYGNYQSIFEEFPLKNLKRKISEGNIALSHLQFVVAMERFTEALKIAYELNDSLHIGLAHGHISLTHGFVKNNREALQSAIDANRYLENHPDIIVATWCKVRLGIAYFYNRQYEIAKNYLQCAVEIAEENGMDKLFVIHGYISLANIHLDEGQEHLAEELLLKTLNNQTKHIPATLIGTHFLLGKVYMLTGKVHLAVNHLKKSQEIAEAENDIQMLVNINRAWAKYYANEENPKLTAKYYSHVDSLNAIIFDRRVGQQVQSVSIKFQSELEKTEAKLSRQTVEIEKLTLEKKSAQFQTISTILLLVLTLTVAIFIYGKKKQVEKISTLMLEVAKSKEQLLAHYIEGQEEERNRISRDLHDGIGSQVAILKMRLSRIINGNETRQGALENTVNLCDEIYNDLRSVANNLMPRTLLREGLVPAINELCSKIAKGTNITIAFNNLNLYERLPLEQESSLFRIVQEITANIVKHSSASNAIIDISCDENFIGLSITWNGKGFDPKVFENSKGLGWKNIKTRLNQINGYINIDSSPHLNFSTIIVEVPNKMKRTYGKTG